MSIEPIRTIQDFAAKVGKNLDLMSNDFAAKRGLVESLDVQVTLTTEVGEKVIYARYALDKHISSLHPLECMV